MEAYLDSSNELLLSQSFAGLIFDLIAISETFGIMNEHSTRVDLYGLAAHRGYTDTRHLTV